MASELVRTHEEDGVLVVELRDRASKNALSPPFVDSIKHALGAVADTTRVVVLRGLPDVFCAGASHETLAQLARREIPPTEINLPRLVLGLPVPVIAAMEGHAIGGGLALGLSCDIVLLAQESRYGCSFMDLGFTPGMGMTRLLETVMPPAIAHEMLYTAEPRRGADLERVGFNYVLPRAELWAKVQDLALRIADKPRHALTLLKRTLSLPRRELFEETHTLEALMHERCFSHPETLERIEERYVE